MRDLLNVYAVDPSAFGLTGIPIVYKRCIDCRFIFTNDFDDWAAEDWSKNIYNDQYVKVDPEYVRIRPQRLAEAFAKLPTLTPNVRILDYGSGQGVFETELRKKGFTAIDSYDPFSHPMRPTGHYDIIFASEVIEHSPRPHETIKEMLSFLADGGVMLFTTPMQGPDMEHLYGAWGPLSPRNGHVSLFGHKSFEALGAAHDLSYGQTHFQTLWRRNSSLWAQRLNVRPYRYVELSAPYSNANDTYHGIEKAGEYVFRWSKTSHIKFELCNLDPHRHLVELSIPFVHAITADFLNNCTLECEGETIPLRVIKRRGSLRSLECTFNTPSQPRPLYVTLKTPAPIRPVDILDNSSKDKRSLGLGISLTNTDMRK